MHGARSVRGPARSFTAQTVLRAGRTPRHRFERGVRRGAQGVRAVPAASARPTGLRWKPLSASTSAAPSPPSRAYTSSRSGPRVPPRRQERARSHCLEHLVPELHGYGVRALVMEARTPALNKRDVHIVITACCALPRAHGSPSSTLLALRSRCCGWLTSWPEPSGLAGRGNTPIAASWLNGSMRSKSTPTGDTGSRQVPSQVPGLPRAAWLYF